MTVQYLHGLETIELDSPSGPVETVKSNVIGLVGTAPDADPDIFPLNTPVPVFADALKAGQLKSTGTLLDAVDAIYSQKSAVIVVTRVAEGETQEESWSSAVGSPSGKTGIWSLLKARPMLRVVPKLLVAPGLTGGRPTNGVKNLVIGDQGSNYVLATTNITIQTPPTGGRQAKAVAQVVGGKLTGAIITDPGYGYTDIPTVTITGAGAGASVTATLGHVANPVGVAFASIVDRLRAVAFLDGPGTSYEDAVEYRQDYGSQRISIIDPGVLSWDTENSVYVQKPASAYAAGIQARVDEERGFWYTFSNELIQNIGGPSRPVDFMPNDRDCEANMLNAAQVTTVIHDDGFRFWGVRGTGTDPLWAHLSVRRTADMVYESLERAERSRMDKPFSLQLLADIQLDVNSYLRLLRSRGALIGGKCWIDANINTPATFAAGELSVDFDLEPPALLEHLQFRARRNPQYYVDFIEEFNRSVATNG
ncbi:MULTISPECIES: phage tail sheath subtilisin-like domain-containing protein [Bradyrhizobium]|uniref:Phage tail sheath protein FI n=1 Tax=Bradyrhizobium elkanii TaxID=29448 RepID=A0A8I1YBX0_BRAEL|nr:MULTISPECIES: phage tail sheath subtilisin-like domain-containing protein [Bradyrhizobium]MBP1297130.1 phage tail sheath protein FI [Bradyrhizobium elkanii]MCP1932108.1 phage tail sheath protein FI [Bradyrhizobium elkanii]MCS3577350.1 phage tail sheath protein FI [Bradyrhizobium elkanii]MCS3720226.1 phage tail sheath protein FI [Bradyrhizobium elkanii]MCS3881176.1 phage tail sheath protein FI [Bradyrhizobium elkanii]